MIARKRETGTSLTIRNKELREENKVLRIQVSSKPPRNHQPRGPRHDQEAMYPENASPLGMRGAWPNEEPVPTHRAPQEKSYDSTHVSSKRQREKKPPVI